MEDEYTKMDEFYEANYELTAEVIDRIGFMDENTKQCFISLWMAMSWKIHLSNSCIVDLAGEMDKLVAENTRLKELLETHIACNTWLNGSNDLKKLHPLD